MRCGMRRSRRGMQPTPALPGCRAMWLSAARPRLAVDRRCLPSSVPPSPPTPPTPHTLTLTAELLPLHHPHHQLLGRPLQADGRHLSPLSPMSWTLFDAPPMKEPTDAHESAVPPGACDARACTFHPLEPDCCLPPQTHTRLLLPPSPRIRRPPKCMHAAPSLWLTFVLRAPQAVLLLSCAQFYNTWV